MRRLAVLGALAIAAFSVEASADYLEVRRPSLLKASAARAGETLRELKTGNVVDLVGAEQVDGYYEVRTPEGQRGFIYRTLVRRHRGPTPVVNLADDGQTVQPQRPAMPELDQANETGADSLRGDEGAATPAPTRPKMRAHLINVGQGAATLFEFSCGVVLVDTGGESSGEFDSDRALGSYLEDFFNERPELERDIDLLVITHPHLDHVRGAELVTRDFQVRNVVTNGLIEDARGHAHSGGRRQAALERWARANAKLETIETTGIPKGGKTDAIIDPVQCPDEDPKVRVLWGHQDKQPDDWTTAAFDDANNHSVVVRVDFGKSSFLITGDLELDAVPAMVAKHAGSEALDVDVWQVSHHGSANGTGKVILDAVTPQIALLGTGDSELSHSKFSAFAFGHPRATVVSQLLDHLSRRRSPTDVTVATGVKAFKPVNLREAIYATGWDGSVVVTADNDGKYRVLTDR